MKKMVYCYHLMAMAATNEAFTSIKEYFLSIFPTGTVSPDTFSGTCAVSYLATSPDKESFDGFPGEAFKLFVMSTNDAAYIHDGFNFQKNGGTKKLLTIVYLCNFKSRTVLDHYLDFILKRGSEQEKVEKFYYQIQDIVDGYDAYTDHRGNCIVISISSDKTIREATKQKLFKKRRGVNMIKSFEI